MAKKNKKSEEDSLKNTKKSKQEKSTNPEESKIDQKDNKKDSNDEKDEKDLEKIENDEKKSDKNDELEKNLQELQDRYLRLSAEFDNYRKRTLKEKADLTKSATSEVLVNILPVIDDFERGLETIDNAKSIEAIQEGMKLIHTKLKDFIKQNGVKEIEAKEKEFDTDLHEAITKIPAPKEELKGKVVDVIQKGYKLNDRVIRYAKVVIGE